MFHSRVMSNSTTLSNEDASTISYGTRIKDFNGSNPIDSNPTISPQQTLKIKKKRNLPGNPDPDAEVIALSPKSLLATNRFVCEICNKGFQRDQNLQLHRRGHNLPWKLKQRKNKEIVKKRAYVCPEPTCVHNHPSRALGDLTGIKKHFSRKHGEKKWKCEKCEKIYAVQSDWKAHNKTCGTREYVCDCGTLFIRKDSFVTHRAFCDALAQESARLGSNHFSHTVDPSSFFPFASTQHDQQQQQQHFFSNSPPNPMTHISLTLPNSQNPNPNFISHIPLDTKNEINSDHHFQIPIHISSSSPLIFPDTSTTKVLLSSPLQNPHVTTTTQSMSKSNPTTTSAHLSATSLLQKAATIGITTTNTAQQTQSLTHMVGFGIGRLGTMVSHGNIDSVMSDTSVEFLGDLSTWHNSDRLTRDFLGLTGDSNGAVNVNVKDMLNYASGVDFNHDQFEHELCDHSLLKPQAFGFAEATSQAWGLQG